MNDIELLIEKIKRNKNKPVAHSYLTGDDVLLLNITVKEADFLIDAVEKQISEKTISFISNEDTKIGFITFKKGSHIHKCPSCGTLLTNDKYCRECGKKVERT